MLAYINKILENLGDIDSQQVENVYYDLRSAGVVIPSGEGRSKGALSIPCSEMAKMSFGKIVIDRSDVGFPGTDITHATPILRRRYGQVCLLINSGSGKSLMPLLDAQKLAYYIANSNQPKDFRIDVATSEADSPLGVLGQKYGNLLVIKGRETKEPASDTAEFKTYGIMEDLFTLGSSVIFHSMVEAMYRQAPATEILSIAKRITSEIPPVVDSMVESDFFSFVLSALEQRKACFFAGLGSSQEVCRMTTVRVGHVKRAIGDQVYVAGESNTPPPRVGDMLVVVSMSGETEIVASWCRNFKALGGQVAGIVGTPKSTIESLCDKSFVIDGDWKSGVPSDFYIKVAFALSPLPIYLVERAEQKGLRLPEYILNWHRSVIS